MRQEAPPQEASLQIRGKEQRHVGSQLGPLLCSRAQALKVQDAIEEETVPDVLPVLCQEQQVTAHFGNPPCRREQRLCYLQVEGLLRGQGRQAVEGGALHRRLAGILCVREHRGVGRPSLLPLSVQFIRPAQVGVKMLDLRRGKRGFHA